MDEHNRPDYSGEEYRYSYLPHSQTGKIRGLSSLLRGRRLLQIFIGSSLILLVVVVVLGFIIVHLLTTPPQIYSSSVAKPTVATGATQVKATSTTVSAQVEVTPTTVVPTSAPAPSSAVCSKPCIVYQEDGSDGWSNWALATDWRIVNNNKLLSNDGSAGSNQAGPSAVPPYSLPQGTQNFAIEVGVTIPQTMNNAHFSITACGSTTSDGWQGYEGAISSDNQAQIYANHDQLAHTNFSPNPKLYLYRLEVRGNVMSLLVNGGLVAQATDNKFLPCGSQIGIVSSLAVIHVSSFKVILL